jgi:hypothetical protein
MFCHGVQSLTCGPSLACVCFWFCVRCTRRWPTVLCFRVRHLRYRFFLSSGNIRKFNEGFKQSNVPMFTGSFFSKEGGCVGLLAADGCSEGSFFVVTDLSRRDGTAFMSAPYSSSNLRKEISPCWAARCMAVSESRSLALRGLAP